MSLKKIMVTLLFSVMLLTFDHYHFLDFFKSTVSAVTLPVQIGFYQVSKKISYSLETLAEIGKLRDRNRDLEYNFALLSAENTVLKKLEAENRTLRDQIGAKVVAKKLTLAHPIGFATIGTSKYLMIDKGSNDGVKKDKLVILKDILIGKVIDVTPLSANVMLVTDPEFRIPVVTTSKAKGLLVGQYQQNLKLTKVLPEEKLNITDFVLTSGEANFPPSLVIGKIDKVTKSDKEIFQEADVSTLTNIDKLEEFFILD